MWFCVVLCCFLLVCACLVAFVWFCVIVGCCQLFSLRLCVSMLFLVGLGWSRCACVVLCGFLLVCVVCMVLRSFGLLSTVFAAFVCSVWFWPGLGRSRCVCFVLCGFGLVSAGLGCSRCVCVKVPEGTATAAAARCWGAAAATGSLQRAPEVLRLPTPPKHGKNTLCPKAHEKDAAEARQKHSAPRSAHKKAHSGRQRTAKSTLSPSAHLKKTLCRQSTAKTRATAPKFSLRLLRVFTRSCCQYDK